MSAIPPGAQQSHCQPPDSFPFNDRQPDAIRLYPLSNYTFGVKETQPEEDPSVKDRLKRLEEHYANHGMRRTCEAVLVCHEHNHPHVLMLQIANAFFKLPGDYIPYSSEEIPAFKSILASILSPPASSSLASRDTDAGSSDWNIHSTIATWYRPNFETFMYPYLPPHVTRPKEVKKLYLIELPRTKVLSVPKNMKLLAVPLFELYDNSARYGPQLSAIPHYLSRLRWEMVDEQGEVVAWTPGGKNPEGLGTKVLADGGSDETRMEDAGV
ncbi:hypothetical protein LTR17_023733 [Elasticomyces elasticus]|nr:hypothetical protein LTR17_023733 [Elasticomyces elasticus]